MQLRIFLLFICSLGLLACQSNPNACCASLPEQRIKGDDAVIGIKGDTEQSLLYGSIGYEAKSSSQ